MLWEFCAKLYSEPQSRFRDRLPLVDGGLGGFDQRTVGFFETDSRWSMAVSAGSTNGWSGLSRPTPAGRWRSRPARSTECGGFFETGSRWSMAVSASSTNGLSGFSRPTRVGPWRSRRARPTDGRVYRDRLALVHGGLGGLDQRQGAGLDQRGVRRAVRSGLGHLGGVDREHVDHDRGDVVATTVFEGRVDHR